MSLKKNFSVEGECEDDYAIVSCRNVGGSECARLIVDARVDGAGLRAKVVERTQVCTALLRFDFAGSHQPFMDNESPRVLERFRSIRLRLSA